MRYRKEEYDMPFWIFSTAYALPMAIASSSAAMIFKIMLHPTIGIIDKLLGFHINWISDPKYALACVPC